MLKKLIISGYFSLLLLASTGSCTSSSVLDESYLDNVISPSFPQQSSEVLPNVYLRPYAEIIQPRTLDTFKHLSGYDGHALIGNTRIQAVISGVPPRSTAQIWAPLVLAYFHRVNGNGPWVKLEGISETSFRRNIKERPIAIRTEAIIPSINQTHNAASLEVVFSQVGTNAQREFIKLYMDDTSDELIITVDAKVISDQLVAEKNRITLRIERKEGMVLHIPFGLILYAKRDVLSVTVSKPLPNAISFENESILVPSPGINAAGWDGFVLGIGPRAGAEASFLAQSRETCFSDSKTVKLSNAIPDFASFVGVIRDCQAQLPSGKLLIRMDNEPDDHAKVPRRFMLLDAKGRSLGYTYGLPGSSLNIPLVPTEKYRVKEIDSQNEWGKTVPIILEEGGTEILSLSARDSIPVSPDSL